METRLDDELVKEIYQLTHFSDHRQRARLCPKGAARRRISYCVPVSAGVFYTATKVSGVQIGIVNISEDVDGTQIGIVNISSGQVRGAQVGIVNISRDLYGIPSGLVNVVENGIFRMSS